MKEKKKPKAKPKPKVKAQPKPQHIELQSESEEEHVEERRVTFRINEPRDPSDIHCETPPMRHHRITSKIANLMWPGIGLSWWMRNPVVRGVRRHFYVAWFFGCVRRTLEMKGVFHEPEVGDAAPNYITFEIMLKDLTHAVVGIYLNKHGPINPILESLFAADAIDLRVAFQRGSDAALKEMKYLIENITFHITDIQPTTGAMGTQKKGMLQKLIMEGQLFPPNDLWQMERDRLNFDWNGRTVAVGEREGMLLIMKTFLKPLINMLINPVGFELSPTPPTPPQAASLRIMASIFTYIYRRAISPRAAGQASLPMPQVPEIAPFLIPDQTLMPVLKELKQSMDYADGLLREWAISYIRRLRMTALGLTVLPNYASKDFDGTEPFILAPDIPELPPP